MREYVDPVTGEVFVVYANQEEQDRAEARDQRLAMEVLSCMAWDLGDL